MSVSELEVPSVSETPAPNQSPRGSGRIVPRLKMVMRLTALSWQVVGIALLWLLALNLVAWVFLGAGDRDPRITDAAMASLATDDRELAQHFAQEAARINGARVRGEMMRWEPYAYWRMRETKGRFINVGPNGLRRTVPATSTKPDAPRIYLFGGSVMWGSGARDEHTIPSYLAELLRDEGIEAEVVNLGQMGYVSTQELAAFEQCCREHDVPAVAVFYHGVNDIFSAIVNGAPGLTMHEANRRDEFNLLNRNRTEPALVALVRNLPLYRLLDPNSEPAQSVNLQARASLGELAARRAADPALSVKLRKSLALHPLDVGETSDDRLLALVIDELMVGATDWLKTNADMAAVLGAQFGAQVVDVWQPTVFSKEAPSPYERQIIERDPILRTAFRVADRNIDGLSTLGTETRPGDFPIRERRIYTLAGVLDGNEWSGKTAYVDFCHVTEPANLAIAKGLLPLVLEALEQRPHVFDADHL